MENDKQITIDVKTATEALYFKKASIEAASIYKATNFFKDTLIAKLEPPLKQANEMVLESKIFSFSLAAVRLLQKKTAKGMTHDKFKTKIEELEKNLKAKSLLQPFLKEFGHILEAIIGFVTIICAYFRKI